MTHSVLSKQFSFEVTPGHNHAATTVQQRETSSTRPHQKRVTSRTPDEGRGFIGGQEDIVTVVLALVEECRSLSARLDDIENATHADARSGEATKCR